MPVFSPHPTSRFVVWLLFLLVIQCLDGWVLVLAFPAMLTLGRATLLRGWRLLRRARWLLLSMLVVFSWGVAGDPLWSGGGAPTREGVAEAMLQLGRLLLVLFAVAALLQAMPLPDLLSATHRMLAPLRRFGFDPDRGVARLMLVLRYVETLPPPSGWRTLLASFPAAETEVVELDDRKLRRGDYLLMAAAGLATAFLILDRWAA